jgi:hypothetical protein
MQLKYLLLIIIIIQAPTLLATPIPGYRPKHFLAFSVSDV